MTGNGAAEEPRSLQTRLLAWSHRRRGLTGHPLLLWRGFPGPRGRKAVGGWGCPSCREPGGREAGVQPALPPAPLGPGGSTAQLGAGRDTPGGSRRGALGQFPSLFQQQAKPSPRLPCPRTHGVGFDPWPPTLGERPRLGHRACVPRAAPGTLLFAVQGSLKIKRLFSQQAWSQQGAEGQGVKAGHGPAAPPPWPRGEWLHTPPP